jgi:hypothetical protein
MDPFGSKMPKIWTNAKSWSHIIRMNPPSLMARMNYCKTDPVLSSLTDSQIQFMLEVTKDISFRALGRISRFLE